MVILDMTIEHFELQTALFGVCYDQTHVVSFGEVEFGREILALWPEDGYSESHPGRSRAEMADYGGGCGVECVSRSASWVALAADGIDRCPR